MAGVCVLVAILGLSYEAWFSLMWVLIYDLFSTADAPDVSGILSFCWGVAALAVPVFETLILASTSAGEEVGPTFLPMDYGE